MKRTLTLLLGIGLAACSSAMDGDGAVSEDSNLVGGTAETQFPEAGYRLARWSADRLSGPRCGATVIGERAAVTAAHCVAMGELSGEKTFGIGFGDVGSSPAHVATRAIVHPDYTMKGKTRYLHDVAVLLF